MRWKYLFQVSYILLAAFIGSALAQQYGYDGPSNNYHQNSYQSPKVNILSHKQALGHDGSFNYAFNADNGIQQGESISPDGSRQGSYSYVDPNGKTVSLKYIAGKDGFRVLEGDHIPRAVPLPPQHAAAYHAAAEAASRAPSVPSAPYRHPYNVDESGADDHSHNYNNYRSGADDGQYRSGPGDDGSYRSAGEEIHSGPHSFGNGFAFEFGGGKYWNNIDWLNI